MSKQTTVFIRGKLKNGGDFYTFVPFAWYGQNNHKWFRPVKPIYDLLGRITNEWSIEDPYIEKKMGLA